MPRGRWIDYRPARAGRRVYARRNWRCSPAAGDSNRTIASKLVISVSAMKKHTGNIYGKLNVSSRTQAVARAREIGLLDAGG